LFRNIIEKGGHSQPLRDADTIRTFLTSPAVTAIMDAPYTPLYLGLIYVLHPLLGHLALVGAIVLFCLAMLGEKLTREVHSESNKETSQAHRYTDVCGNKMGYAGGSAEFTKLLKEMGQTEFLPETMSPRQAFQFLQHLAGNQDNL